MKRLILPVLAAARARPPARPSPPSISRPAGRQASASRRCAIEPGRYRVTFHGGPGAPPAQVQDYALLRAADLTLADGYDWFRVTDRDMRLTGGNGPRLGLGIGGASFGRHSAVGGSVGTGFTSAAARRRSRRSRS